MYSSGTDMQKYVAVEFECCFRVAVKYYVVDFFVKGRAYPPIPLSFFGQNDFLLRGEGGGGNSLRNSFFCQKCLF